MQQKTKETETCLKEEAKFYKTTEDLEGEATGSNDHCANPEMKSPSVDTKIEDLSVKNPRSKDVVLKV